MKTTKSFTISKHLVMRAFELVKANAGAAGTDQQSIDDFEADLKNNLYKLWNRMTSGSYFPPSVRGVNIPKKQGGKRLLGIPTVADRVAQMVIKIMFEPFVEEHFYSDSYGYRPNKSALDAIGITRQRCWRYNWVLEFDIKGLFDNINHDFLMRAVKKHTDNKCILLYIERWLKAPMVMPDGTLKERTKGTPQGGVISPVLSNLFLHYVFDSWITRNYKNIPWCRYADDGLLHCTSEQQAQMLLKALGDRFKQCDLELHPDKTKIVYCKDGKRRRKYPNIEFTFLGYTFRRRTVLNMQDNSRFLGFSPAASKPSLKSMRARTRKSNLRNRTDMDIQAIANLFNPILSGWLNYYGHYHRSAMDSVLSHFNMTLIRWAKRKYKHLRYKTSRAVEFMEAIAEMNPSLFVHWNKPRSYMFV